MLDKKLVESLKIPDDTLEALTEQGFLIRKRGNLCISPKFRQFLTTSAQVKAFTKRKGIVETDDEIIKDISNSYRGFLDTLPPDSTPRKFGIRMKAEHTTQLEDEMSRAQEFLGSSKRTLVDETHFKVAELARSYYSRVNDFNHQTNKILPTIEKTHPNYRVFEKALKLAEELRVTAALYLDAQFYFFQSWFRRCPHVFELVGPKSQVRVVRYLRLEDKQKQDKGALPAPSINLESKFRTSERQLKTFMKNYSMTEEQVLKMFAQGHDFFDSEWLKDNETYQKLKNSGEV